MVDCKSFGRGSRFQLNGYELVDKSMADQDIELSKRWLCQEKTFIRKVYGNSRRSRLSESTVFSVFGPFRSILIIDAPPKVGMG